MDAAIKYNFDNVLVADTKLLGEISENGSAPQILVLNNRLNKCANNQQPVKCDTCCLQVEESQFRRRSDAFHNSVECFAKCSERRLVGIELKARERLSGKLVILALTRSYNLRRESSSAAKPIRCRTETMVPYFRFEPDLKTNATNNQTTRHTHYSRFSQNSLPSMTIKNADLHWDASKQRELISFGLHSNKDKIHNEMLKAKETLVVIEMACFNPLTSTINNSSKVLRKIHLLALINRDVIPNQSALKPIIETLPSSTLPTTDSAQQPNSLSSITESVTAVSSQNKRAVVGLTGENNNRTTIADVNKMWTSEINDRIDSTTDSGRAFNQNRLLVNETSFGHFEPGLVHLKDLDSIRMRLKSNSFLILTVSSSFVILTYTLCLLIYLKSRKSRPNQTEPKLRQNNEGKGKEKQTALDISPPFNLQMPPETQTRLEKLLNSRNRYCLLPANSFRPLREQDQGNRYAEISDRHKLVYNRQKTSSSYQLKRPDNLGCQCCNYSRHKQATMSCGNNFPGQTLPSYYGTLSVMQAIRQAATLARCRLRNTRYQPNLKAIPESDYEQHYATALARKDLEQLLNNKSADLRTVYQAKQIETLLQDAMSSECSHIIKKHKRKRNQTGATLLSRPIEPVSLDSTDLSEDLVSRSRIIRHVQNEKEETSCEEQDRDSNTRI